MAARARELSGVVARRRILLKNDLRTHAAHEADMVSCDAVLASGSRSAKQGEVPAAGQVQPESSPSFPPYDIMESCREPCVKRDVMPSGLRTHTRDFFI